MPTRLPTGRSIQELIDSVDSQLRQFSQGLETLPLRQKVKHLVVIYKDVKDIGVTSFIAEHPEASAAPERILAYLVQHVGQVIDTVELEVVAGISEYARRIRELRVEDGYQIASGASPDPETGIDLRPEQYMLVSATPDREAAHRWAVAKRIRNKKGIGAQKRIVLFLEQNVGKVVTTDELAYVAKSKQYARRTRELRTQKGYAIATKTTGRPDLSVGQYVLESLERAAEHDRNIDAETQAQVYSRDNNTCQCCGWSRNDWVRSDPRVLELHHIEHHAAGGANTVSNLIVLCSKCHVGVHAQRLECPSPEP